MVIKYRFMILRLFLFNTRRRCQNREFCHIDLYEWDLNTQPLNHRAIVNATVLRHYQILTCLSYKIWFSSWIYKFEGMLLWSIFAVNLTKNLFFFAGNFVATATKIISFFLSCQCDQNGYFWKFLSSNFLKKVAQMFGDFWAVLKNIAY